MAMTTITCAECGSPIPDPLQQHGPQLEPLCWECYSGEWAYDDERRETPEGESELFETVEEAGR